MHRHPLLDLGYTHDVVASCPRQPSAPASSTDRARDLTSRLLCLRALDELERDHRAGRPGLAFRAEAACPVH